MLVDRWGGADGLVGSINSISSLLTLKSLNPLGNTQETLKDQLKMLGWVPHRRTERLTKCAQIKDGLVSEGS